ncbi:hypothetical protein EW146_g2215 [Bondarzewia mesenterica]|uniref:Phosphatidic acid phosphatase type 2/haloperoxidase domain-containing protein n=1 Tax=Bondarzewia mesenterica TaxID=1095465 RepID=A0A4S4M1C7_9AGAM|nr:hypothetical protein EW146_g2215 [Bondarzewia mesenterica]
MVDDQRTVSLSSTSTKSFNRFKLAPLNVSKFTLDDTDSLYSPSEKSASFDESEDNDSNIVAAGRLSEEVYSSNLPWWRAAVRSKLVRCVEWESGVLARVQERVRTPWLDAYFVYTSTLGTHTFFMCFIPAFFFFGYDELGRGLVYALGLGVYSASFLKDLACSPRPYAPPVTRLTIGLHHLEYGFPSTHTTNGVSMALFLLAHAHSLLSSETIGPQAFAACTSLLIFYVFSIVGGRLYTGMHGFVDCAVGFTLGTAIWAVQWAVMPAVERWIVSSGWRGPPVTIALCLLSVNQHPQPVDDCPCFEDAIAFISVMLGVLLGKWFSSLYPMFDVSTFVPLAYSPLSDFTSIATFFGMSLVKLSTGILTIFAFRLLAKPFLHAVLPPLFRCLAKSVRLPNRRHYTPATEYVHGPHNDLRPIPSVMDLDMAVGEVGGDGEGVASARRDVRSSTVAIKRKGLGAGLKAGNGIGNEKIQAVYEGEKAVTFSEANEGGIDVSDVVKRYDAVGA